MCGRAMCGIGWRCLGWSLRRLAKHPESVISDARAVRCGLPACPGAAHRERPRPEAGKRQLL